MEFAKSGYLRLLGVLPAIALLLAWAAVRRRKALSDLGAPSLVDRLSSSVSFRARRWKTLLWFVAFSSLVVALARPLWGSQVVVKAQRGVEVMVVLDVSASMLAEDLKPSRLDRAKLSVQELMNHLGGNDVGLVIFSGAAFVQFPLTADLGTARAFLDASGPQSISRPGTELEEALRVAVGGFSEERATSRAILLLTDGEFHEHDPVSAAEEAASEGIVIHAIGFGSPDGEPIPLRDPDGSLAGYKKNAAGDMVLSRLDEITLQRVALETGGLYFRASAGGGEIDAIASSIAALETGEREAQFETHGVERFEWFAGFAMLALMTETLMSDRRRDA